MKIAYFSPLSPLKSGIVDYSEKELLPFLKQYCDIDIYIDDKYKPTNKEILSDFKVYSYKKFPKNAKKYDSILYQMGNNPLHEYMYDILQKYPGIVILHDLFIHGLIWNKTIAKGDQDGYIKKIEHMYGKNGEKDAKDALKTHNFTEIEFKYPFIKSILECSNGIIVHSMFGKKIVLNEKRDMDVKKINCPVISPHLAYTDSNSIRKKYGFGDQTIIIGIFGFMAPHKRIPTIMNVFKIFHDEFPDSALAFVGEDNIRLKDMIKECGIKSAIQTGFVPFETMYEYMQISDICVNLRYPTAGETSMTALRMMDMKKPIIVSNIGWLSEIPDKCCAKVDVDNFEEDLLLEYLRILALNEKLRMKIGENARHYVEKQHNPEIIAKEYYDFMEYIIKKNTPNEIINDLIKDILTDMSEIGLL